MHAITIPYDIIHNNTYVCRGPGAHEGQRPKGAANTRIFFTVITDSLLWTRKAQKMLTIARQEGIILRNNFKIVGFM